MGKKIDHNVPQPEHRQGRDHVGEHGKCPRNPVRFAHGGIERYGDGKNERNEHGSDGEHEGAQSRTDEFSCHRQARADGRAEVALEHVYQPREVLNIPCLRRPHCLTHAGPRFFRGHLSFEQHAEGVAGRKVEDDEDHEAHSGQEERRDHEFPGQHQGYGPHGRKFHSIRTRRAQSAERKKQRPSALCSMLSASSLLLLVSSGMNHSSAKEKNL